MMGRFGWAALVALLVVACGGSGQGAGADLAPLPRSAAGEATATLVRVQGIDQAVASTREVLRTAGITATPLQEFVYAMDARRKPYQGRLDSSQVAQMLETFGLRFPGLDPARPADRDTRSLVDDDHEATAEARYAEWEAAESALKGRLQAIDARYAALVEVAEERRGESYQLNQQIKMRVRELRQRQADEKQALHEARRTERHVERMVGRDDAAGRKFMAFLADWVREAAKDPGDPHNFAPLFLAEMARRQARPIDLAAEPHPREHMWTLLELSVFAAAFHPPERQPPRPLAAVLDALVPTARAASPCEAMEEAWGGFGGAAQWGNAELTGNALQFAAEEHFGDGAGNFVNGLLGATSILGKVMQLAAFYSTAQVTVEGEVDKMHKPDIPTKFVFYTATAGVDPEELEAYEELSKKARGLDKSIRDCLGWGGIADLDSIKEVAEDAEHWLLDWRLHSDPDDAYWAPRDQQDAKFNGGRWAVPMKRVSPSSVEAKFVIRVKSEGSGFTHTGPLSNSKVIVSAEVDSSGAPPLSTFINSAKGLLGIADSLVELAAGWTREVFKPKTHAVLDLEFHCPNPTTVHRYIKNPVADGGGEGGEGCTFAFDSRQEYEAWRDGWE